MRPFLPLLLTLPLLAAVPCAADGPYTAAGTLRTITPHPPGAWLLVDVQQNVAVVLPVTPRTVVTINGHRSYWPALRPGDHVVVGWGQDGNAITVEARR